MNEPTEPARSNQSCTRCYRRKKKCSRTLPRCSGCEHAQVACSFEELCGETGLFPITYVKGLERKIAQLEGQIRRLEAFGHGHQGASSADGLRDFSLNASTEASMVSPESAAGHTQHSHGQPTPLASELQHLSLETAADRYLGSSSGVSFARLTQAVLRRLGPDQYAFGYEGPQNELHDDSGPDALPRQTAAEIASPALENPPSLPSKDTALLLAEYYWSHSHLLYPFMRKSWFMTQLLNTYEGESPNPPNNSSWLYTMWMVFAIGATSASAIMPGASDEEANKYWRHAQTHFYSALSTNDITALNALMLQISYSFFNRVGSNIWYLVGAATRLAIGLGLHAAPTEATRKLPLDVQQYRKRIFWCLYMADRVVSISLGRPFGIRDEDIEIDSFANVDDENILPDLIKPQSKLKASQMSVPLHILALRKIAGEIFDQIYSTKNRDMVPEDKNVILDRLHSKLVDWRRNMPFPLPHSRVLQVPHTCTAWYDLNYHTHLVMLYRPSPMFPSLTLEKVHLIAESSVAAIRQVAAMHREHRYSYNWHNLFNFFTVTLTLIYAITAQPDPLPTYLKRSDALGDLELANEVLTSYAERLPAASKCQRLVQGIMQRFNAHLGLENSQHSVEESHPVDEAPFDFLGVAPSGGLTPILFGSGSDSTYQMSYPSFWTGNELYDQLQAFLADVGPSPEADNDWLMA